MRIRHLFPVLGLVTLLGVVPSGHSRVPVATNDTYSIANDLTLNVSAPGVLVNDFDSNGHAKTVVALESKTFTFNGITFDQALTPNVYLTLTAGTYSNATVTAEPNETATEVAGFPDSAVGFQGLLSIGHQFRDESTFFGTKALNLPRGNAGTTERSGFELSWASGVMLTNLSGDDFVVFEAGGVNAPEAFMVQVHNSVDDVWTPWVYIGSQSSAPYDGGSSILHATKFNLDTFGIPANGRVDRIRLVNITSADRMQSAGEGIVLPGDNGATSAIVPDPPGSATAYTGGSLDPDIVYVGVLHILGATIPAYSATSELGATVVVNSDGSFSYDPSASSALQALAPGETLEDTFYYLVTDGNSGHAKGLVTVTVSGAASTRPALTITLSGSDVILRWPNTTGYYLESTLSLSEPAWEGVEAVPEEDGDDLTLTLNASIGNAFFRLAYEAP
ncbi:MAG TPA: VCBS domain-containing protein [Verrucomicrobiae bacterium]